MENSDFGVVLGPRSGWFDLRVSGHRSTVDVSTHWLSDNFRTLLDSVLAIADGSLVASAYWPIEVAEGYFLDFLLSPGGSVSICISRARGDTPDGSGSLWSAERGETLFHESVPARDFVVAFTAAFWIVRRDAVNPDGIVDEWGHLFPATAFERLVQTAESVYGFKLTNYLD